MRRCLLPLFLFFALVAATPEVTEEHPVIVVVPLGTPSEDLVEFIAESLRERFLLTVRVTDPEPLPEFAWYPPRKRWRAEKLLTHLKQMDLGEAWRVTGITEEPISTTKGKRYDYGIAGLADMGSIGKLLSDKTIHDDLHEVLVSLRQLLDDIRERPGRYTFVSVF